jgi:hypothetical protein
MGRVSFVQTTRLLIIPAFLCTTPCVIRHIKVYLGRIP